MEHDPADEERIDASWQMALYADTAQTALAAASSEHFDEPLQSQRVRRGFQEICTAIDRATGDPRIIAEVYRLYELALRVYQQGIPVQYVLASVADYRGTQGFTDWEKGENHSEAVAVDDRYLLLAVGLIDIPVSEAALIGN